MKADTNIEQLKSEWAKQSNNNLKHKLSPEQIREITRTKSKNQIDILKRKFIIENIKPVPIIILLSIYITNAGNKLENTLYYTFLSITFLLLLIPMLKLFRIGKLKNLPIAEFLNKAVPIFKQVLKSIIILSTIVFPIGFISGLISGTIRGADVNTFSDVYNLLLDKHSIFFYIILTVIMASIGYVGIRLYYKAVYKKNIDALERLMIDLNETKEEEEEKRQ